MAIVLHCTEGSFESADSWIKNIQSAVSYHYVVKSDGEIVQYVKDEDTAWANGLIVNPLWEGIIERENPNLYTISIAFAGLAKEGPTLAQVVNMAKLVANLSTKHNIPIDYQHVIPHNEIRTDKLCPGSKFDTAAVRYLSTL